MATKNQINRSVSVPMRAQIWGFDADDSSELNLLHTINYFLYDGTVFTGYYNAASSDLAQFLTYDGVSAYYWNVQKLVNPIRVIQPHYGQMTQVYLDYDFNFGAADITNGVNFYFAIGKFSTTTNQFVPVATYPSSQTLASWQTINGNATPVSAALDVENTVNLTAALYQNSNANFIEDAFVLLLIFNKLPSLNFAMNKLNFYIASSGVS
jgi:hypothetical protein